MGKFCPNCGTALDDIAVFCGNCGTKLEAPAAPQQPVYEQPIPQQPKKSKKGLVVAIVATVAVIGIAAALYFGGVLDALFGSGYDKALDTYLKARMMYQCEDAEDLMPEEAWDTFEEERFMDSDDFEEYLVVQRKYLEEELDDEYGSNPKFSYKVTKEKAISDGNLKNIAKSLANEYGIKAGDIKKGFDLTLDVTIKGSEDSETSDFECAVVLIDDDWYVISWEDYGDGDISASFMP